MEQKATIDSLAERLRVAEQTGVAIPPIKGEFADGSIEAAYAVQQANTEHGLANGRRIVGRKIGLTAVAVQKQLGVDQPDFGVLFADMCFSDREVIPAGKVLQPRVEAEVAIVLGRDLPDEDTTIFELVRAVEYVVPALEVVGSRIANWEISILDTVADNASSGAFVLGTRPVRPGDVELGSVGMAMSVGSSVASVGSGAACLGHPYNAAVWLARTMAKAGSPLRAGDVLMSGALGPMVPLPAGAFVEATIQGLGSVHTSIEG